MVKKVVLFSLLHLLLITFSIAYGKESSPIIVHLPAVGANQMVLQLKNIFPEDEILEEEKSQQNDAGSLFSVKIDKEQLKAYLKGKIGEINNLFFLHSYHSFQINSFELELAEDPSHKEYLNGKLELRAYDYLDFMVDIKFSFDKGFFKYEASTQYDLIFAAHGESFGNISTEKKELPGFDVQKIEAVDGGFFVFSGAYNPINK